jgi:murein DD-endopeptidase MepM/ murein hydrolase activator NlpD
MVQIEHANNIVSSYCHLSRFASIHAGEHIEPRELIGYVGQTGRATGPHLHFAVKKGEMFIDPLSMKLDGVHVLPPKEKDAFDTFKNEMDAALDAIDLPEALDVDASAPVETEEDLGE